MTNNVERKSAVLRPSSSRYRLTECIAKGGMGAVYLGVQRGAAGFERPVAIKRTHGHLLGTPERRQLILQEARNAAAVRHPNVVGIEDVEEVESELLLIMPYIDGSSLSHLLRAGRVPIGMAMSIIRDACAGLHAIHTASDPSGRPLHLLHRDISPQNILIGLDGMARIIDFGISKSAQDPTRTSKQDRRGKFGYMAPEYLARGISSPATDVFAMGVVLWEALAGRRLFPTDLGTRPRTRETRVPLLHLEDDRVSEALDAVVQKALALKPEERFRTAADLSSALEEAVPELMASRYEVAAQIARLEHVRPSIAPPRAILELDAEAEVAVSATKLKAAQKQPPSPGMPTTPLHPVTPSGTRFIGKVAVVDVARQVQSRPPREARGPAEVVVSAMRSHALHVCVGLFLVVTAGLTYACVAAYADRRPNAEGARHVER